MGAECVRRRYMRKLPLRLAARSRLLGPMGQRLRGSAALQRSFSASWAGGIGIGDFRDG